VTGLALLLFLLVARQDAWSTIWTDLESLRAAESAGGEVELARARLNAAARAEGSDVRLDLLRLELDHLAGRDVRARAQTLARLEPSPFGARELWFLADPLPPGEERVRCILAALAGTSEPKLWQARLAWNVAVDEAMARRFEAARPVQELLYRRFPEDWAATDLALTYRHLGLRSELEAVFEERLARAPSDALWSQYAIATLGHGDERRARDYLGRALALGSADAAQVLARLDLVQGRTEAARTGFRAILQTPPMDWAWRGWGLSLLPEPFAAPAVLSPTNPHE